MASNADYPGAIPLPPGATASVEHPYDCRQLLTLATACICIGLASLFFFTRVYVKIRILRTVLLEDGATQHLRGSRRTLADQNVLLVSCALAWVMITIFATCIIMMVRYGLGLHAWEVLPETSEHLLKWLYITSIFYCPAAFFTKVTLLLLIARIFTVRRGVSTAIYIFVNLLLLSYIIIEIMKILICLPIHSFWDGTHGKCLKQPALFVTDNVIAIITDTVILLAPIPLTWSMRLPVHKKVKIMSIMGVGGIAVGLTVWRLVLAINFLSATDFSWSLGLIIITTIAELTLGIICSCFPTVHILMHRGKQTNQYFPPRRVSDRNPLSRGLEGTTIWRSQKTTTTMAKDTPDVSEPPLTNINAQLAMLARPSPLVVHDGALEAGTQGGQGDEEDLMRYIQGRNSVSSATGRREGWLAGNPGLPTDTNNERTNGTVDISLELSRITGNRVWDRIWDGQSNTGGSRAPSGAPSVDGREP
ncbi:hypothetical protein S7711_08411 [Stachybotrys chartarum IBT 7711]|uniref:Rhodopsin domain-containing protein n=1 Tax=Stachybotrys chartarum (strain CBS 109288 / IBT 7711) TaxID=1280523 RepID=A0A084AVL4_STACB|nr:hypothetical protein S7711_08411 [Stachybotrys chartarum IBT 7711]